MSEQRLSRQEATDLLRHCVEQGAVIPGWHFRKELANEGIGLEEALAVLEKGVIYDPPELDVRTRDWKYRGDGRGVSEHYFLGGVEEENMKKPVVCSACGAPAKVVRASYPFREISLPNVVLQGINLVECPVCGNVDPIIPRPNQLMRALALAVIRKPYRLHGEEVRFLRKYLRMMGEQLSQLIHVDKTTLSKWENN
jgi:hypothetical protein